MAPRRKALNKFNPKVSYKKNTKQLSKTQTNSMKY